MAMKYELNFEMTGLGMLVHGLDGGKQAQALWLEGGWKRVPRHRPRLVVDLADAVKPDADGIDHEVVRLADGRSLLLIDLYRTELTVDACDGCGKVELFTLDPFPKDPGQDPNKWRDLRFIAAMEVVTNGRVHGRHLESRTYRGQVQARFVIDKGRLEAAMPHDPSFRRKKWIFPSTKHMQHLTDRLVWRYTSPFDDRSIELRLTKKKREAVIRLRPKNGATVGISASCYPGLESLSSAALRDASLSAGSKPEEWGDFPLFYEVLTPLVDPALRDKPVSDDPAATISDAWCPTVQASAR
jgi:hypothetical protein